MRLILILVVSACTLFLQGCGGKPEAKSEKLASGGKVSAVADSSRRLPISMDDARSFASKMEDAAARGDNAALIGLIDWQAILEDSTKGIESSKAIREGFSEGFMNSVQASNGLISVIAEAAKKGGSFKLLNIQNVNGSPRPMFRLLATADSGLNYFQMTLRRAPDGTIRAVDFYPFASGEQVTETIRRLYLPVAAHGSRGLLDRLTNKQSDFVKSASEVTKLQQQVRAGQNKEALATYARLPESVQMDKAIMLQGLMAAQGSDDATYLKALGDLAKAYPNDPCLDLLSIDVYSIKKDYPKVLESIERLDKAVGGDAHLDILRANTLLEAKDSAGAKAAAERAIEKDPRMIDAYWTLLAILLERKEFAESADTLDEIGQKFGMEFDLEQNDAYAEFLKSPEYAEWLKRRTPEPEKPEEATPTPVDATSDQP